MNKILYKVLAVLVSLCLLAFLGYQAHRHLYEPYQTETAIQSVQTDSITADGIAVRNEIVLPTGPNGVTSYLYDDGEKVSSAMPVAEIYESAQDAANEAAIKMLAQEIGMLEKSGDSGRADYINGDVLNSQISEKLGQIIQAAQSRNLATLKDYKTECLMLLNTRQIATDRAQNFDARVAVLSQKMQELQNATRSAVATIAAPEPGYFVSMADGYETELSEQTLEEISPSQLASLLEQKDASFEQTGAAGKIITGFEWYFAILVPKDTAGRFTKGAKVSVSFPYISDAAYTAAVDRVVSPEDAEESVVVLKLNSMNGGLSTLRFGQAEISFLNYRGIKVRMDVMRFQGSQPGVYVKTAETVLFKKLDILFYGNGYVMSALNADKEYLQVFDEIIVAGRDLEGVVSS